MPLEIPHTLPDEKHPDSLDPEEVPPIQDTSPEDIDVSKSEEVDAQELGSFYQELHTVERLGEEQADLRALRGKLGLPAASMSDSDLEPPELATLKAEIEDAEKKTLGVPEGESDGKTSIETPVTREELLELHKEMRASIEKAREEFIKLATGKMLESCEEEFKRSENGKQAEAILLTKFPMYLRHNLATSETAITHLSLKMKTFDVGDGTKITYVESVDIENREPNIFTSANDNEPSVEEEHVAA